MLIVLIVLLMLFCSSTAHHSFPLVEEVLSRVREGKERLAYIAVVRARTKPLDCVVARRKCFRPQGIGASSDVVPSTC